MQARIWVKAFIPGFVYDSNGLEITSSLSDEDEKKISLIPLQSYIPSLTPLYETDNRTFSDSPSSKDSARITTIIEIPKDEKQEVRFTCYSNPTRQITKSRQALLPYPSQDAIGGIEIGFDNSATEHPACEQKIISRSKNNINLSFTITGSNPFFYFGGISLAPPIRGNFDLSMQTKDNGEVDVSLRGKTTQFPAFEAYAQINGSAPITLFRREPQKGKTPFHLMFGATENVEAKISCNKNGLFSSKNNIKLKSVESIEISQLFPGVSDYSEDDEREEPFNPPVKGTSKIRA